jgi:hypothetical protein
MTQDPNTSTPSTQTEPSTSEVDESLVPRLKAANPVPLDETRSSSWDGADSLFSQITSRPAGFDPYVTPASAEPGKNARPRWPVLAAVAAALVLLVSAVVVLAPGNSQPALATVTSAADQTAAINSGRVTTTFAAVGHDGAETENLDGTLSASFNGEDVAVSIDIDPSSSVATGDEIAELSQAETRMVDGQVFITSDGDEWLSIEAPEFLRSALIELTDLRTVLAQVTELVEVDEVGSSSIDGVSVTHYESVIDLADESLAESGWLPGLDGPQAQAVDIEAEGLVTIDLYVDDDGLMRRIRATGAAKPGDPEIEASIDFVITTDFTDLGTDITIEAPDAGSVQSLTDGFGHDE